MCVVPAGDGDQLAWLDHGRVVLWNPATGGLRQLALRGRSGADAICTVVMDGRTLLAVTRADRTIELWLPEIGKRERILSGHDEPVRAVCVVPLAGRQMIVSAGDDGTVRLWNPDTGRCEHVLGEDFELLHAVCGVSTQQTSLAWANHEGAIRVWHPAGDGIRQWQTTPVRALCTVTVAGHVLLASGGDDGTVRLWAPDTGELQWSLPGHTDAVTAVAAVPVAGRHLLASASCDGTIRLWDWDATSRNPMRVLKGHSRTVFDISPVTVSGHELFASRGYDRTICVWDPISGDITHTVD